MALNLWRWSVLWLMACTRPPEGLTIGECSDLLDNDIDGLVDCFDPDCVMSGQCGTYEGMSPGQCSDGVDNDGNGLTDCQDPGCFSLCSTDVDDTPVTPPDDPPDTPPVTVDPADQDCADPLGSFEHESLTKLRLQWQLDIDLASICDQLCALSPVLCDCTSVYEFDGTLVSSGTGVSQYEGTWRQLSTTCQTSEGVSGTLADSFIWRNESDPSAYMTVFWEDDGATVKEYTVHRDQDTCDPLDGDWLAASQLYEAGVDASFDSSTNSASRSETVTTTVDMCEANFTSIVDMQFE